MFRDLRNKTTKAKQKILEIWKLHKGVKRKKFRFDDDDVKIDDVVKIVEKFC